MMIDDAIEFYALAMVAHKINPQRFHYNILQELYAPIPVIPTRKCQFCGAII